MTSIVSNVNWARQLGPPMAWLEVSFKARVEPYFEFPVPGLAQAGYGSPPWARALFKK